MTIADSLNTHKRREDIPEKIQVMQRLTSVGCLFAFFDNKKVPTSKGRRIVLKVRLKKIQTSRRAEPVRLEVVMFPNNQLKEGLTQRQNSY